MHCIRIITLFVVIVITQVLSQAPNIVLMVADDLGWNDVGYYGASDCYTPYLDDLAATSVRLDQFYSHPKCAPSRAALMTGRHPYRYGFQHDAATSHTIECGLDLNETLLSNVLQDNGYRTYLLGKWHLGYFQWDYTPNYRGFDTFIGFYGNQENYQRYDYEQNDKKGVDFRQNGTAYNASLTGDYAYDLYIDLMEDFVNEAASRDEPFFIYYPHQAPHTPYNTRQKYKNAVEDEIKYNSTQRQNYCSIVYALDLGVGDVIEQLQNAGLWDNTWFIFISDNGPAKNFGSAWPLRGIKSTFFEGGIRVPALIGGGLLPPSMQGTTVDTATSLVDIFGTICSMTGIDCSDYELDGVDISNLTQGLPIERDYLLLNVNYKSCSAEYDGTEICGGIRYGDLKAVIGRELVGGGSNDFYWGSSYCCNTNIDYSNQVIDCGSGTQPAVNLSDLSWDCGYNNEVCLFNLSADPCEYNDLSNDAAYASVLDEMMTKMQEYYDAQATVLQDKCNYNGTGSDPSLHGGYWSPWRTSPNGADGTNWLDYVNGSYGPVNSGSGSGSGGSGSGGSGSGGSGGSSDVSTTEASSGGGSGGGPGSGGGGKPSNTDDTDTTGGSSSINTTDASGNGGGGIGTTDSGKRQDCFMLSFILCFVWLLMIF